MRQYIVRGVLLTVLVGVLTGCGGVSNPFGGGAAPTAMPVTRPASPPSAASATAPPMMQLPPPPLPSATPRPPTAVPPPPPPPMPPPASSATLAAMQMQPAGGAMQVVTVTADGGANVRSGPAVDTMVVTVVPMDTEIAVLDPKVPGADMGLAWVKVNANGQTGYVRSDLVGAPHAPTAAAASPAAGAPATAPTATP